MPKDTREPQSYGSAKDWVTGKTGQQVNDQDGTPAPEHREFYDGRHEGKPNAADESQGGKVSEIQLADDVQETGNPTGGESPIPKVTGAEGGAKRGGYFKKRDYE